MTRVGGMDALEVPPKARQIFLTQIIQATEKTCCL